MHSIVAKRTSTGCSAPHVWRIPSSKALPYLQVSQDNVDEEDVKVNVEVPDVSGMSYKEAKKCLEDAGLQIVLRNEYENEKVPDDFTVSNQVPVSGVQILKGGGVIVE